MAPGAPFSLFFCLMEKAHNNKSRVCQRCVMTVETLRELRQTADAAPRMKWKMMEITANISKM